MWWQESYQARGASAVSQVSANTGKQQAADFTANFDWDRALPGWKAITRSTTETENGRLNDPTEHDEQFVWHLHWPSRGVSHSCTPEQDQGVRAQVCRKCAEDSNTQVCCVSVEGMHRSHKPPRHSFLTEQTLLHHHHGFNFAKTAAETWSKHCL